MLPFYQRVIAVRYPAESIFAQGENLCVFIISDSCCLCNLNVFL